MKNSLTIQKKSLIVGVPILLIGLSAILPQTFLFQQNAEEISIGITVDLLLTVPVIYFLLIRKTEIPKTTVIPLLILGMVVGFSILPEEHHYYLLQFRSYVLPMIELTVLSVLVYTIHKVVKRYRLIKTSSFDFFTSLKLTFSELLPKQMVTAMATEISVFYFGFMYWKRRALNENEFSYHKQSGTIALFIALFSIIIIETSVVHVLMAKWSVMGAWILTGLSVYSGIQIVGFLKSIIKRPISIEDNTLYLRYGIMNEAQIDINQIESVELSSKDIELNAETRKFSILGNLEGHNTILHFKELQTSNGLYGTKRTFKTLALYVDEKEKFANLLEQITNT